jgi:hypothetical protein
MIARIGPISDADGNQLNVYVPLARDVTRDSVVFASTDSSGLRLVAEAMSGVELACEPSLAEAGAEIGATPRQMTASETALTAEVALGLKVLKGVPKTSDPHLRRNFLKALVTCLEAPVLSLIKDGSVLQGEVNGKLGERSVRVGVTCAYRDDPWPTLLFSIVGTGDDNEGDVDLALTPGPDYLRRALLHAYGLDAVPRLALQSGPAGQDWCDKWLPVMTAAFLALSMIDPESGRGIAATTPNAGAALNAEFTLLSI